MKKTKIVCTIGPASNNEKTLKKMIEAGMNVARFNFSHGDYKTQEANLELVKKLRAETSNCHYDGHQGSRNPFQRF